MSNELTIQNLTPKEREAYKRYMESGKAPLAATTAANFFQLYLLGHSTEEIAAKNPAFGLGIIVRAKVENSWDEKRIEHTQQLMANIRGVVQNAHMSAVQFVAEGLAAFQKMAGDKFQKYIQTGDIKELGDFKDMSFKQYKEMLELLMKLTGAEAPKQVTVEHRVVNQEQHKTIDVTRPMTSTESAELLKSWDKKK